MTHRRQPPPQNGNKTLMYGCALLIILVLLALWIAAIAPKLIDML